MSTHPNQPSFFHVGVTRATFSLSEHFNEPEQVAAERALAFFESIKDDVRRGVYNRMRDGGRPEGPDTERGNLQVLTIGGGEPSLIAFGTLVQTFVDEFGLLPGRAFPPWKQGTDLFDWTERHGLGVMLESQARGIGQRQGRGSRARERADEVKRIESIAFLIARAIYARGLPGSEDRLHEPFAATFAEFLPRVTEGLEAAGYETARILNGVGVY